MGPASLLLLGACAVSTIAYIPPLKEHVLSEALLREVVERMGHDLEGYLDEPIYPQLRSGDYQENPTVRDQEYLQHSSLWANPFGTSGETNENNQMSGQQNNNRQDSLPAYCDPPNPCPIGYTAEEGCLEEFENTAAFSREYQAQQDCMCDSEHMFDCSASRGGSNDVDSDFDRLVQHFHVDDGHKNLVAKKFHMKKSFNPYLEGEKLPVAAKKGIHIVN